MTGTLIVSLVGVVAGAWILYRYFKGNYKTAKYKQRLVTKFLNPWLTNITGTDNKYCKIGVEYSDELKKMIPLKPKELKEQSNRRFYYEIMNHPRKYKPLITDWKKLKEITSSLNKERADLFEEIRKSVTKEISLPYYCHHAGSDAPFDGYICFDTFIEAVYNETKAVLESERKRLNGFGDKNPSGKIWEFKWGNGFPLAASPKEELVDNVKSLFSRLIQDVIYNEKIKAFSDKQKETYDMALENVTIDIENLIESIELDNIVEENVQHLVHPY